MGASHLENLQTSSAPQWLVGLSQNLVGGYGEHADSELLKVFCYDIQDGLTAAILLARQNNVHGELLY